MKRYYLSPILLVNFLFPNLYSQEINTSFITKPFIIMPGENTNIDVTSNFEFGSAHLKAFICWVNESDTNYSLYLKETTGSSNENILIYSDTNLISNPNIAFVYNSSSYDLRIVWQSLINNHWQILSRKYSADTLTVTKSITDSLSDNITPTLNEIMVAWVRNGNLIYHFIDSTAEKNYILDSVNCSNPIFLKYSNGSPVILYEKGINGSKQIIEAEYRYNIGYGPVWSFNKISNGGNNKDPRISFRYAPPCFEIFENGVWKSVYDIRRTDTTDNISYNCENPICFSYPKITKTSDSPTPSFLVYDSDSLVNNREIMYKSEYMYDSTLNLSHSAGDDYLPYISFFKLLDTTYVAVFWTHEQNGKKDIWIAYTKYNPSYGSVEDSKKLTNYLILNQNYPNPFNPSTLFSWHLAKSNLVTLKIYDVLGNEITTLVNEYQNAGEHSLTFNVQQINNRILSTGIYFYRLKAGSNILTKKMLYLK